MNGTVRVEELIGNVGENGGTARRDTAFCDEEEEPGEKLSDVDGGPELAGLAEEVGREIFRVAP